MNSGVIRTTTEKSLNISNFVSIYGSLSIIKIQFDFHMGRVMYYGAYCKFLVHKLAGSQ